jgi:hypothetical protein
MNINRVNDRSAHIFSLSLHSINHILCGLLTNILCVSLLLSCRIQEYTRITSKEIHEIEGDCNSSYQIRRLIVHL